METERRRLLAIGVYHGDLDALLHDYRLVFLGDLLSLIFCCGWQRTFEREGYSAVLAGDVLTIRPDPFAGVEVPLAVRGRRVPARRYASDLDLLGELGRASETIATGVAIGRN